LSPHIFLWGPNGSGKTAIINAVELALTGEVRDIGGREKARSNTILADLMGPGEDTLFAVVQLNDGRKASWVMEPGKRPVHTPLEGKVYFPMPEVLNALKGSKAVTARFLIKYFGAGAGFDEVNYGAFADLHATSRTTIPPHERLLAIEEASRKAATAHSTEARALKVALEKLGGTSNKFAAHSDKVATAAAIKQLLTFQVQNNLDTCGVCGTPDIPVAVLGGRLAKVQALLDKLGGEASSAKVQALHVAYEEAQTNAASCKEIASNCMDAIYKIVSKLAPQIILKVSECLPVDSENMGIRITSNNIVLGFSDEEAMVNGEAYIRPHLSGAEMVVLTAAISSAIAKELPPQALVVLTMPDKALDLEQLKGLVQTLKKVPAVTIIQSPFQPRGRPAAGWTRVVLDEIGVSAVLGTKTKGEVYSAKRG